MKRSKFMPDNCPVNQRTGDGASVGRCWHFIGKAGVCELHGDVSKLPEGSELHPGLAALLPRQSDHKGKKR